MGRLPGYILYMWKEVMGWNYDEIQAYIAHVRRQLRDPDVHMWYMHRVVYGQKPPPPDSQDPEPTTGRSEALAGSSKLTDKVPVIVHDREVSAVSPKGREPDPTELTDFSHLVDKL